MKHKHTLIFVLMLIERSLDLEPEGVWRGR